jgi:hypothetical protein
MATVSPTFNSIQAQAQDIYFTKWTGVVTGDTVNPRVSPAQVPIAGTVQFSGTFGGATVKLQISNDGTTYFDMKDLSGVTISTTAAAIFEFTTAALYLRPVSTGGTGDSVTTTLVLRG